MRRLRIATDSIDKRAEKLSGGNQQKVVLAKCLFSDAELLLLDEPTRGVDVGAKSEIYDIIRGLADAGNSIAVFSSELDEVLGICDRIFLLFSGRLRRWSSERPGRRRRACPARCHRWRGRYGRMSSIAEGFPPMAKNRARRLSDEAFITILVGAVAVGLFLVASLLVPNFFQLLNMLNLVTNNWAVISLGVGVTFLLVSGNFDLSVGGVVALSGVLSVWLAQSAGGANPLAIGAGIAVPGSPSPARWAARWRSGALNALFVMRFRVPSIIVTLGHDDAGPRRGAGHHAGIASATPTCRMEFGVLGNLTMLGTSIKLPVVLMAALRDRGRLHREEDGLRPHHLLSGLQPRGGDAVGHRLVRATSTALYLFSATIAGVVGILLASEFKSGYSSRGTLMEFDALVDRAAGRGGDRGRLRIGPGHVLRSHYPRGRDLGGHRPAAVAGLAVHPQGRRRVSRDHDANLGAGPPEPVIAMADASNLTPHAHRPAAAALPSSCATTTSTSC